MSTKTALELLKECRLEKIAVDVCRVLKLQTMEDIGNLSDKIIDDLNLTGPQTKKLKALRDACREGNPSLIEKFLEKGRVERLAVLEAKEAENNEKLEKGRSERIDNMISELKEDGEEYEFTNFLMRHGWDIEVARKIAVSTGCEEDDDILDIPKMKIDSLEYLTDEQKENLWKLVCDRWRVLSVEKRKEEIVATKHREHKEMILQMLKRDDVREKRLGELILRMFEIIGRLPLNEEWREELIRQAICLQVLQVLHVLQAHL
jgi:hypothetical protein